MTTSNTILIAFIIFLLVMLFTKILVKKENLAPMLKRALHGDELSYLSNIGPGFDPTSF